MQMNLGTSMNQGMVQTISPRMIQSMEILQQPVMALQERIEHELEENIFLELREPGTDENGEPAAPESGEEPEIPAPEPEAAIEKPEAELVIDAKNGEQDFERMEALTDGDWSEYYAEESRPSANRISEDMDKRHDAIANIADRPESLQDHLNSQLAELDTEIVNVD